MIQTHKMGATLLAISVLALAGCSAPVESPDSATTTLRLGTIVEPNSWVLPEAGQFSEYYQAVFDTLVRSAPDGELVPMLATDWAYNDDNTVLTLNLRDDVEFTDGDALDSDAVVASLQAFQSSSAPDAADLATVTEIVATDEDTVELHLSAPDPSLLFVLSQAAGTIVAPAMLGDDAPSAPIGSGPYEYDADDSVAGSVHTFQANPNYWDKSLQKFSTVEFRVFSDATATVNALRSGQIDGSLITNPADIDSLTSAGFSDNVNELDWQGLAIYDRAGTIVPALADVRVRQAIALAVDGDAILDTIAQGRGTSTGQVFSPNFPGFNADLDDVYPFDADKARELLAEAGYPDGFELPMPRPSVVDAAVFTAVQQNLADVGIAVTYTDVSLNDFISGVIGGQYAASWLQQAQLFPWRQIGQVIAPEAIFNPFHTTSPELEALIERVRVGDDTAVEEINDYVVDNAWFAPWFRLESSFVTSNKIAVEVQTGAPLPSIYNFSPAS